MIPTEDFGQLRLKFTDPIQHHYEVIRPIVLYSETINLSSEKGDSHFKNGQIRLILSIEHAENRKK